MADLKSSEPDLDDSSGKKDRSTEGSILCKGITNLNVEYLR